MHRKLVLWLALAGPLTAVLLTAPPAGALPLPALPVPTAPALPVALPQLLPPQLPLPTATSSDVTLPSVTLLPPQLPGVLPPVPAPVTPSAPTPGPLGSLTGSPAGQTADDGPGASARGMGTGAPAPSSAGKPTAATTAPALVRPVAGVSGRRVGARQSGRDEPLLVSTREPRGSYFGWFGLFTPFTGRDILGMLNLALAALCVGLGSMVAARRLRPA